MKTTIGLIGLGCALVPVAAAAGESTGFEQPGYWKCQTIQTSPTAPLYVSDIFELKANPAEVQSAFQQTLAAKYGIKPQVSCSMAYKGPGILEKLKGDDQRWFQQIRAGGGEVVETHWTFAPQAARFSYQCWGGAEVAAGAERKHHFFYADPIELPGDMEGKINESWIAHLADLHPGWFFAASQGCQRLPADPAAHAGVVASIMDPWKARNAEIHKLDWTYAPLVKNAADDVSSVFCQALRTDNKHWYVTPVFPMASVDEANAAMNAWRTYVKGLKDPDGMVVGDTYLAGCDGPAPAKGLQQQKAARAEQISDGGGSVVETGWAFVATAAAAEPVGKTYQCYMTSFGGSYLTPGFQSAKDVNTLSADWRAYITKAHPVQGFARTACSETTPKQAAAGLAQVGYTRVDWSE